MISMGHTPGTQNFIYVMNRLAVIFFLFRQPGLPRMNLPIVVALICECTEEVAMHFGCTVVIKVGDKSALIIHDPQGILGLQHRPHPIHSLNYILYFLNDILLNYAI
jgi:hypothetical protein